MRTTALLAVTLLVLAPGVVRAFQPLDCGPSSTGLTFSRSSPVPPVRVQVLPDEVVVAVTHADGPGFADLSVQPPPIDEAAPVLSLTAPPDPTRGPPFSSLF